MSTKMTQFMEEDQNSCKLTGFCVDELSLSIDYENESGRSMNIFALIAHNKKICFHRVARCFILWFNVESAYRSQCK